MIAVSCTSLRSATSRSAFPCITSSSFIEQQKRICGPLIHFPSSFASNPSSSSHSGAPSPLLDLFSSSPLLILISSSLLDLSISRSLDGETETKCRQGLGVILLVKAGVIRDSHQFNAEELGILLQNTLISVEMFLLSVAHRFETRSKTSNDLLPLFLFHLKRQLIAPHDNINININRYVFDYHPFSRRQSSQTQPNALDLPLSCLFHPLIRCDTLL